MAKPGDGPGFLHKALTPSWLGPVGIAQELDRHFAAERHMPSLEHDSHPTGTEDVNQFQSVHFRPASGMAHGGIAASMGVRGGFRRDLGSRSPFPGGFERSIQAVALPAGSVERSSRVSAVRSAPRKPPR